MQWIQDDGKNTCAQVKNVPIMLVKIIINLSATVVRNTFNMLLCFHHIILFNNGYRFRFRKPGGGQTGVTCLVLEIWLLDKVTRHMLQC